MKQLFAAMLFASFAVAASAQTAAPAPAPVAAPAASAAKAHPCQDEAAAKGLQGAERKKFAEACRTEMKQKRDACEAEAKGKKGPEHKAALKECMSK